jgi:hypothetical protein
VGEEKEQEGRRKERERNHDNIIICISVTTGSDYMVESLLDFTFSSMEPGEIMCVNVSVVDDEIDEPTEQFEFYFIPILDDAPVTFGDPLAACVNIQDNDSEFLLL